MIAFFKRLGRDRRGSALIIGAACLPLVIGAAGLATDTIQWTLWKRQLQRAADSAAIAGVYNRQWSNGSTATTAATVSQDLELNLHTVHSLKSGYPQVAFPPNSASMTNQVSVTVAIQQPLPFSSLFMGTAPTITANGTAASVDEGRFCLVALDTSTTAGISASGSAGAHLGCGVITNSTSNSAAISLSGTATLHSDPTAAVGGLPSDLASRGALNLQPFHLPEPDPYAGKYDTTIPAGVICKSNISAGTVGGVVQPGCYNNFGLSGTQSATLAPGVYYLNNTNLTLSGSSSMSGNGVTFVFTGTNPGRLDLSGTSTANISAPTSSNCGTFSGTNSCNFKNMLMIQSSAAAAGNTNTLSGSSGMRFDGALYFPKGIVNLSGSSSDGTQCLSVVAYRVGISGTSTINVQTDTSTCEASTTVAAKKIRLVA